MLHAPLQGWGKESQTTTLVRILVLRIGHSGTLDRTVCPPIPRVPNCKIENRSLLQRMSFSLDEINHMETHST